MMTSNECQLINQHCKPCEGDALPLDPQSRSVFMSQLNDNWQLNADNKFIFRDFRFKNYYQTMAFVNAIAWQAHAEGHHPDLEVGYNHCLVKYTTHAIEGLSENDFICAAKIDSLFPS